MNDISQQEMESEFLHEQEACFTGQDYALAQLLECRLAPKGPVSPP